MFPVRRCIVDRFRILMLFIFFQKKQYAPVSFRIDWDILFCG